MKDLKRFIRKEFWKFTHLTAPCSPINVRGERVIKSFGSKGRIKSYHDDSFRSGYKTIGANRIVKAVCPICGKEYKYRDEYAVNNKTCPSRDCKERLQSKEVEECQRKIT